jgi:hypothetical protein
VCPVPLVPGPNPASPHAKLVDHQKDFIQEQRLALKIWIGLTLLGCGVLAESNILEKRRAHEMPQLPRPVLRRLPKSSVQPAKATPDFSARP